MIFCTWTRAIIWNICKITSTFRYTYIYIYGSDSTINVAAYLYIFLSRFDTCKHEFPVKPGEPWLCAKLHQWSPCSHLACRGSIFPPKCKVDALAFRLSDELFHQTKAWSNLLKKTIHLCQRKKSVENIDTVL